MLRHAYNYLAALFIAATISLFAFPAFAQDTGSRVSLLPFVDAVMPYLIDLGLTAMFVLAAWVATALKKKLGVDIEAGLRTIEANHRDALHSALASAVAALVAKAPPDSLSFDAGSRELADVLRYVRDSVPEALAHFQPSDALLAKLARAKLSDHPLKLLEGE